MYVANTASDNRLIVVRPNGSIELAFGRAGDGPYEVRKPVPVSINNTTLAVWDAALRRLSTWTRAGVPVQTTPILPSVQVYGASDSGFIGGNRNDDGWQPVLVDMKTNQLKPLTGKPMPDATQQSNSNDRVVVGQVLGLWPHGFLIADGNSYRVDLYSWNGAVVSTIKRTMPPQYPSDYRIELYLQSLRRARPVADSVARRVRNQLAKMAMPYFSPGGIPRMDSHQRLWIVGQEGDSAFADLFLDARYLYRLHIPCKEFAGAWNIAGDWLAMACLPDNSRFDGDAVIKLFRIDG